MSHENVRMGAIQPRRDRVGWRSRHHLDARVMHAIDHANGNSPSRGSQLRLLSGIYAARPAGAGCRTDGKRPASLSYAWESPLPQSCRWQYGSCHECTTMHRPVLGWPALSFAFSPEPAQAEFQFVDNRKTGLVLSTAFFEIRYSRHLQIGRAKCKSWQD